MEVECVLIRVCRDFYPLLAHVVEVVMAKLLDKIIVIDLESTCWEGPPPPGQISEIIEIGITTVDVATLSRGDKRSILIRPVKSDVSEFCTRLTTITAEQLSDAGSPLPIQPRRSRSDFEPTIAGSPRTFSHSSGRKRPG